MAHLETVIRWRPYPEQKPQFVIGVMPVIITNGDFDVCSEFESDKDGWNIILGDKTKTVTHFALPEDITTREVEG